MYTCFFKLIIYKISHNIYSDYRCEFSCLSKYLIVKLMNVILLMQNCLLFFYAEKCKFMQKDVKRCGLMLVKDLKLEIVDTIAWKFITLKKKNGRKFKSKNCKELKALRESGFFLQAVEWSQRPGQRLWPDSRARVPRPVPSPKLQGQAD